MSFTIPAPGPVRPFAGLAGAAIFLVASVSALPLGANAVTPHHGHRHTTVQQKRETVEARIASLHASLMITPDEEQDWTAVAQVMRTNEAATQTRVEQEKAGPPHGRTAVQDLRTYEAFTQAHVDGLKTLISSFEVLYAAMPAPQQAVADRVFRTFGHRA
jgi:hypothetical protein